MGQLKPIALEDGTTIYIEATDDTAAIRLAVMLCGARPTTATPHGVQS
jgi:hypothetical protein